jgi:hypothetical protein
VKIPFQIDLFEYAVIGLMRRPPDESATKRPFEAVHTVLDIRYKIPMGKRDIYRQYATQIRKWLDHFDILLSGTRVDVGIPDLKGKYGDVLQIKVSIPAHQPAQH